MENKPIVIFCTTPDMECAQKIATILVEENLAACCNILNGVVSVFKWKNKVQNEKEYLLIIKSLSAKFTLISEKIMSMHPYETPEIIATDLELCDNKYLKWIIESVR